MLIFVLFAVKEYVKYNYGDIIYFKKCRLILFRFTYLILSLCRSLPKESPLSLVPDTMYFNKPFPSWHSSLQPLINVRLTMLVGLFE